MPSKAKHSIDSTFRGLEVKNISKSYKHQQVCNNISINTAPGEIVGLLGPNGAGKTTMFNIIAGIISPQQGKIIFNNQDITRIPIYKRSLLGLSYLPQSSSVFRGMTVEENLLAVLQLMGLNKEQIKDKAEKCLKEFKLEKFRLTTASMLSGGERRRLEIARTSLLNTVIYLLDEPFAGIDPISIGNIHLLLKQIRDSGKGILLTDHNIIETLEIVDRVYVIIEGSIVFQGNPQEVKHNKQVESLYLGKRFSKQYRT